MKLCLLSSCHSPADDRVFYKEAISLTKRYSDITILTPPHEDSKVLAEYGIKFVALKRRGKLGRILGLPAVFAKLISIKPDVCHFHDYELIFLMPLMRLFGIKPIYDIHESNPDIILLHTSIPLPIAKVFAKVIEWTENFFLMFASHAITADDIVGRRLEQKGFPTTVVFNYPRLELLRGHPEAIPPLAQEYAGKRVILHVGGIAEHRGLFVMVRSLKKIRAAFPDAMLVLIGPYAESLHRKAMEIAKVDGTEDNLRFLGWVAHDKIGGYIGISRMGLVPWLDTPKYHKNIPIKVFEYMSGGLPVIGSNIGQIHKYISESDAGLLVTPNDHEALADAATKLLSEESLRLRYSHHALKAVEEKWNWAKMEERLFDVYQSISPVAVPKHGEK